MGHSHDETMPKNFEITIRSHEGSRVSADVHLTQTIPPGGVHLEVVYDLEKHDVVSVRPWRKMGQHVLEAIARAAQTLLPLIAFTLVACGAAGPEKAPDQGGPGSAVPLAEGLTLAPSYPASAKEGELSVAIFAGGCFWCVESEYDDLPGVQAAISGYIGGPELSPSYSQVSSGATGHTEAVRVVFDPRTVTYEALLALFWKNVDPFRKNAQFCDRGTQYRSGVFPLDADQRAAAHRTKAEIAERFGKDVVTEVTDAGTFWTAEDYHQDFHHTNPAHYKRYRLGCGRDRALQEIWGDE